MVRSGLRCVVFMALALASAAQRPAWAQAGPGEVESEPIRCWWKTEKTAVHIAEQFTLTLTCGSIETGRFTVVPRIANLEPTALQLLPFEIMHGTRHEEIVAPPWRYVQFEYTMRLLGETFFGQDVDIPALNVPYTVRTTGPEAAEGREETYTLPALPMRIASLVPRQTSDIRDGSRETFGAIEARLARATTEIVAGTVFIGFAVVLVGIAGVRALGTYRVRAPSSARPLSSRALLGTCARAIGQVRTQVAGGGWTPELVTNALAAFRVAGAVALRRPVAESRVEAHDEVREGQLLLQRGVFRRTRTLLSASTTPDDVARWLEARPPAPRLQRPIEQIRAGLAALTTGRYQSGAALDATALDAALSEGAEAISRLRVLLWRAPRPRPKMSGTR